MKSAYSLLQRLLKELNKQTDLVNQLSNRVTTISTSEMGLHFVIDDLKAENMKLKCSIGEKHDLVDKQIQTSEEASSSEEDGTKVEQEVRSVLILEIQLSSFFRFS